MSRLINPGTGDYLDRLTILALKLLYGEQAGKETKHFRDERNAILGKVGLKTLDLEGLTELATVNAALWHAEDQLRDCRNRPEAARAEWVGSIAGGKTFLQEVCDLAFRIQALNDRRAALVTALNQKAGDTRPEEQEKLA